MEPIFTDKQLNNMSREDLISLMKIVQEQTKKKDTEIQLLKEKQKEQAIKQAKKLLTREGIISESQLAS